MLKKAISKLRNLHAQKDGSDTIEMVGAVAILCVFILIGLMLLSYIMGANVVSMAARQVARNIETSGYADVAKANADFANFLRSNTYLSNLQVTLSTTGKVQLTDTFRVTASCTYDIPLVNPGNYSGYTLHLPIKISSMGMSEVYWSQKG